MSGSLRPFFTYYGGKFRSAPRYPTPAFSTVIEPFAGSAGYSLRYPDRDVLLLDKNPIVANLWRYLISVSESEIRSLPTQVAHVDDVRGPIEARHLIGFWLNKGSTGPRKTPSTWARGGTRPHSYWGETIRERVASQLQYIRHWRCSDGCYTSAPDIRATWFIDPPYQSGGALYPVGSTSIDFERLGEWCRSRPGQAIVCESEGAHWLPFRSLHAARATPGSQKKSLICREVVWYGDAETRRSSARPSPAE